MLVWEEGQFLLHALAWCLCFGDLLKHCAGEYSSAWHFYPSAGCRQPHRGVRKTASALTASVPSCT